MSIRRGKRSRRRGNRRIIITLAVIFLLAAVSVVAAMTMKIQSNHTGKSESTGSDAAAKDTTEDVVEAAATEGATEETTEAPNEETTETATEVQTTAYPATGEAPFVFEDTGDTKYAYLTFDDGPSDNTYSILDILDQYGVKATFFTIGKTDEASIERYKEIANRGHSLGMHSYTHEYSSVYASLEAFQADTAQIHDWLYQVTGKDVRLYRFPGGSSNTVSAIDMQTAIDSLTSMGYIYYDWNVSSGDAMGNAITAEELTANVLSQSEGHTRVVVLMHDANPKTATVQALPAIIEGLQSAGFQIVPITETTKPVQHVKAVYMQ